MPVLDIWTQNFWGLTELTAAINYLPYKPDLLDSLGIFRVNPVTTVSVSVEYLDGELHLVSNVPRGTPGQINPVVKRVGREFKCCHLPTNGVVKADDVQGIRAFGEQTAAQQVQQVVNDKLTQMKENLEATKEYHRAGAIKGIILDADGTTTIYNLFTEFGIAQPTQQFDFSSDADPVQLQCMTLKRTVGNALGRWRMSGIGVLCSDSWFDQLIKHSTVRDAYKYHAEASAKLGEDNYAFDRFYFGGCWFFNYRCTVGSTSFVADDKAQAFPMGTNGLFVEHYAPADYMETVNTRGLPYYAKSEPMTFNKGMLLEAQSNPLMLCHRPQSLVELTMITT